jgi:hypothetical protein
MKKSVDANLQWLTPEEGGRPFPPKGPLYSSVGRFPNQKCDWTKDAWSLNIEFVDVPDSTLSHHVRVTFLTDGAPDILQPNCSFELMEGRRLVARGIVAAHPNGQMVNNSSEHSLAKPMLRIDPRGR